MRAPGHVFALTEGRVEVGHVHLATPNLRETQKAKDSHTDTLPAPHRFCSSLDYSSPACSEYLPRREDPAKDKAHASYYLSAANTYVAARRAT